MRAEDLRVRTKKYASGVIGLYCALPKNREKGYRGESFRPRRTCLWQDRVARVAEL